MSIAEKKTGEKRNFEETLERAASLSLRPSQYAGWEIGSTAGGTVRGIKRVALSWPVSYGAAMKDPLFLDIYSFLASTPGIQVERVLDPGEDMKKFLAGQGVSAPYFSLERKSGLAEFDAVLHRSFPDSTDGLISEWNRLSLPIFKIEGNFEAAEAVEKAFKAWGWMERPSLPGPGLMAYSSGAGKEEDSAPAQPRRAWESVPLRFGYRVRLRRYGWARFLSHLEQIQLIKNVVRLAGLPVARGGSRNSKVKISFGPAVSVGWSSEAEYFDMELEASAKPEEVSARLQAVMPLGYGVLAVQRIPRHFPSLEESANWVEFDITPRWNGVMDWSGVVEFLRTVPSERSLTIRKEKPGRKVDVINVADVLSDAQILDGQTLRMCLRFGPRKNLKPEKILEALAGLAPERIQEELLICRRAFALETGPGKLRYL